MPEVRPARSATACVGDSPAAIVPVAVLDPYAVVAPYSTCQVTSELCGVIAVETCAPVVVVVAVGVPIDGACALPVVTVALVLHGLTPGGRIVPHVLAQLVGAIAGVWLAHLMFDLPILQTSIKLRSGLGQWTGEVVATFGLVLVVLLGASHKSESLPAVVACYITAAYWFTSSTSFANPVVTVARALSDTFAGIAPTNVLPFVGAQLFGAALAIGAARFLEPKRS